MTKHLALIGFHLVAVLLACIGLSLVVAPFGPAHFDWQFFAYAFSNGWGYAYHRDYSLAQVCAYLFAYASGLFVYPMMTRPPLLAAIGTIVCIAGTISFCMELSHWFFDHNLTLIASFPILLLPIAIWTLASVFHHKAVPAVTALID